MSILRRSRRIAAAAALVGVAVLAAPASAAMSPGSSVWVVKDQAGGAFYNATTGARYVLTAASAVPTWRSRVCRRPTGWSHGRRAAAAAAH